jgi:hypothetical protein
VLARVRCGGNDTFLVVGRNGPARLLGESTQSDLGSRASYERGGLWHSWRRRD